MVSLAFEQWPDSVLPHTESDIPIIKSTVSNIQVAPQHLFFAWEQMALVLAELDCQVVCRFKATPIQKTLVYGIRTMPLRIHEIVHDCDIRGFMKHSQDVLDVICKQNDTKFDCPQGWRVSECDISSLEIRTHKGSLVLEVQPSTVSRIDWFGMTSADEVSCWLWSVSSKKNARPVNRIDIDYLLTENMKNIIN